LGSPIVDSGRTHFTLVDRAAVWASWAMAGAIFLTIGWFAMAPDDPRGAVSVLARHAPLAMLVQAAGLAGITAALATVLAGRRRPHVGTFAAGIGLAAVSLRGESAVYLLLLQPDPSAASQGALAGKLMIESGAWFLVLLTAGAVSTWVTRWLDAGRPPMSLRHDWQHAILAAGVGVAVFYALGGGVTGRAIQHGQACFLVAASVCIAAYVAHRLAPARSPIAPMAAVGLMGLSGYAWAWLRPGSGGLPANVPASPFLRVLPVQFMAVGIASAVAMYWHMMNGEEVGSAALDPSYDTAR
jgi:hypothetical protein